MPISINGSTGISGINGSAATPAIQGGDSDTGIFFGTDTASIATAGTSRLHVDSSGQIGVNTASPAALLQVVPTAVDTDIFAIRRQDSSTTNLFRFFQDSNITGGTGGAHINTSNRNLAITASSDGNPDDGLFISSQGNVAIGTTTPQAISGYTVLTLNNASQGGAIEFKQNNTSYGRLLQGSSAVILESKQDIPIQFGTGTSSHTRMEIAEGGNVGIGVTDAQERLDLAGTLRIDNLTDLTFGYPTKLSPLKLTQYGDYQRPVIALAYKHPGGSTKVNLSGFWGWIYAMRGSQHAGLHNSGLYVQFSTAYNAMSRGGAAFGGAVFRFVTFTYDSTDYIGVQFNTDSSAQLWMDGYYFRRYGFKPFTKSQSEVSSITAIGANQVARFAGTGTGNI